MYGDFLTPLVRDFIEFGELFLEAKHTINNIKEANKPKEPQEYDVMKAIHEHEESCREYDKAICR